LLFLLAVVFLPSLAGAATYFVNTTTDSDSLNNCTAAQNSNTPKKTIGGSLGCVSTTLGARANQIVEVAAGVYTESLDQAVTGQVFPTSTSWSAPFTLRAKAGDLMTIKASGEFNMQLFSPTSANFYAIISGFIFDK